MRSLLLSCYLAFSILACSSTLAQDKPVPTSSDDTKGGHTGGHAAKHVGNAAGNRGGGQATKKKQAKAKSSPIDKKEAKQETKKPPA